MRRDNSTPTPFSNRFAPETSEATKSVGSAGGRRSIFRAGAPPPRYDPVTNNLTWAIRASSEGSEVINHSVRLLGRKGVMDADLVLGPSQVGAAVPEFDKLLTGFEFSTGNRYAEWVKGDRIAEYGLTALVAGGVGAAAVKSGLLGKIWKALVFGALAVAAALKRVLGSLFGSKEEKTEASATAQ